MFLNIYSGRIHVDCISLNHHLVEVASTEILLFSLSMIIQLTFSNSSLSFWMGIFHGTGFMIEWKIFMYLDMFLSEITCY